MIPTWLIALLAVLACACGAAAWVWAARGEDGLIADGPPEDGELFPEDWPPSDGNFTAFKHFN